MKSIALVPKVVSHAEELPAHEDPASPKIGKWYMTAITRRS